VFASNGRAHEAIGMLASAPVHVIVADEDRACEQRQDARAVHRLCGRVRTVAEEQDERELEGGMVREVDPLQHERRACGDRHANLQ
jgi:hypothetical protein